MRLEAVEVRVPEGSVSGEPAVELGERLGSDAVDAALRIGTRLDEAGVLEHAQVLGDGGLTQWETFDQVADGPLPLEQQLENRQAARVDERLEGVRRAHHPSISIQLYSCQGIDGHAAGSTSDGDGPQGKLVEAGGTVSGARARSGDDGEETTMNVAVLGMGRMGRALAGRLLDGGHELVLWNRSAGRAGDLVDRGASEADRPAAAVAGVELAITSLADDDAVREVALGDGGIRDGLAEGATYVDASTVSPSLADELDASFDRFVAMPVLGSPDAVAAGSARYLVGARGTNGAAVQPIFAALTTTVLRFDAPRQASTAKLCVNLLLLDAVVALAESFAVGRAGGLSDDQLRELLGQGPMIPLAVANRFEGVLTGEQRPWWSAALGAKDAGLALDIAAGAGVDLPATSAVRGRYELAAAEGADDIALVGTVYRP